MKPTDVTVKGLSLDTEEFMYRTPIKFGGVALDRVTLLNVTMTVETRDGKVAEGFGSMPLGNVWAFPAQSLSYEQTLNAMQEVANRLEPHYRDAEAGHPLDLSHQVEPAISDIALSVTKARSLVEPMPLLAAMVANSPFDAALHDAFGKVHGLNCFKTYGDDFVTHDLGHYLGSEFAGERLSSFINREPKATMPLYHLVGALDPLTSSDIALSLDDGLSQTLGEWIDADGLTHLKIKLNGDDLAWDIKRVLGVDRVATQRQRTAWHYSLDFNERCQDVAYLLEFLHQLKEQAREAYERIQYIEQPTARDLHANRHNVMHEAAKLKPIVIDESLLDLASLQLAREMGYTGVAFKACKGQSQTLLLAAAAQKFGMFRCVQDLTCPGASLIQSASLAAHVPGVAAIEANSRQYVPAANDEWDAKFPGIFSIRDGVMQTAQLNGLGLGAV